MSKSIDKERADAHYSGMLAELTGPAAQQPSIFDSRADSWAIHRNSGLINYTDDAKEADEATRLGFHVENQFATSSRDGVIASLTGPVQPQIDDSLELLIEGYQISDGPMVDIYGESDIGYGYEVQDICITGTQVSLYGLVAPRCVDGKFVCNGLLNMLSAFCDDTLPSAAEMREESRQQMLIDKAERNKELES